MQRGFFDRYPRFYETGIVHQGPRLNARYECLIARHLEHIEGKTILDIGSHDGRWSFAALTAGAQSVIGIEPRAELVDAAERNIRASGIDGAQFYVGDALETMIANKPKVDTVFLFGVLYHIHYHVPLLRQLWETEATSVIVDTWVAPNQGEQPYGRNISFRSERLDWIGNGANEIYPGAGVAIVGHPSRQAVRFFFHQFGFDIHEIPWRPYLRKWGRQDLGDYASGKRATFLATRAPAGILTGADAP